MDHDTHTNLYHEMAGAAPMVDVGLREHMLSIYKMMTSGMLITAATAWIVSALSVSSTPDGQRVMTDFGNALFGTPLKWVVAFAPLVMLLFAIPMMGRLSSGAMRAGFYAIAAVFGVSMASILLAFTGASIATAFLATAAGFAGLSIWGYATKRDLGPVASFLVVGLIGLIVVMIVNIFIQSTGVALAVSAIGVLIFAGLTAADTQRAKQEYLASRFSGEEALGKMATMSALSLYLDFLNLFQFLLSFLGVRRD